MRVVKWGNSLAVRLPAAVVDALELRAGDEIELHADGERSIRVARTRDRAALLAQLATFRGHLPADFKFDREEVNGR